MRHQAYGLLADPATGLNPEFVQQCRDRNISVPSPGMGGTTTEPFNFGRNSGNVFQARLGLSYLEEETEIQYPCFLLYGLSTTQIMDGSRVLGMIGSVMASIEIQAFLGWSPESKPANNDFESPIDALEESFVRVLNRDSSLWHSPVLYRNDLNVRERFPVTKAHNGEILRTGLRLNLSARYEMG
jgi:hypothetical protein